MTGSSKTFGIIGGGIMGMTIAMRLAQRGHKVTIIESSQRLGGLTDSVNIDGIVWDKFYHVILMSDLNTRKIIKEIGIEDRLNWVITKTGFFSGGKLYSMSNVLEYLLFPPLNLVDKFRLGLTIIIASLIKNGKRLEGIPVEKWLRKWSGKKVFDKVWLPLLRAKLGDNYRDTSAAFIWTTIQRMYAARRSGLKKEMFGYVTGGYDKVNSAFDEKLRNLGITIVTNTQIRSVESIDPKGICIKSASGESYAFDEVISTLPSDISTKIAPSLTPEEIEKHKAIRYLGVICPSILLKRSISEFYVTNITDSWPPFTGIIEMTALIDPKEFKNSHLIYLPKYLEPASELFNKSESELRKYFLDPLFRMYPELSENDILHFNLASARRVFALPTLNYSDNLPSVTTSLKGYYIINSAQITNGTLNVNETIQIAEEKLGELHLL